MRAFAAKPARLWQLALAFLAGNLGLQQLAALPSVALLTALAAAALAVCAGARLSRAALPAVAVLAFCWTGLAAQQGLQARWPAAADGRDIALTGWVDGVPTRDAGRIVFSLRVTAAATGTATDADAATDADTDTDTGTGTGTGTESLPRRARLSWYEPAPALAAGQALAIVARLRAPRGLSNPGGFDYERWLFLEGYDATGYVREGRLLEDAAHGLGRRWLTWRAELAAAIADAIPDADAAALVLALSLGDRSRFEDRHWTTLQRTGTGHLVAVSGLHIGLVAAFAYCLVLRLMLWLPYPLARHAHSVAAALAVVPAAVYAALAGFALPTQRALVMVLVAQALVILRGRWPVSAGLSLALIAVLSLDPLASLTASFWLSFGAVALIAATLVPGRAARSDARGRLLDWAGSYGRLQWTLTIGLVPFLAWYFGLLAPMSLLVNLLAIPLFSFVLVPLSLIACLLTALLGAPAAPLGLAGFVAALTWQALDLAAASPYAAFAVPRPSLAAFALALLAILAAVPRHGLPGRRLALLGLLPLVAATRDGPEAGTARLTVLDVGHGLAVDVETATHRLLYDAGPLYRSGFDAGAEIVAPALAAISPRPLDLLLISHGDSDHAGGAAAILRRYPGIAVMGGPDVELPGATVCAAGAAWSWDGVAFSVLHPPPGFLPEGNESSCVLRIETDGGVALLTGDIERRAEARLESAADLAADVVVVPHHGSLTSSRTAFVRRVEPELAIVSAGFNNRWGFPREEVRERWEAVGARVLVTGDEGAIELTLAPGAIELGAARDRARRYWQPEREPVSGAIGAGAL